MSKDMIVTPLAPAPAPAQWCGSSARRSWVVDPLVLDGCFQAVILWCWDQLGAPSLPSKFGCLSVFCSDWSGVVARAYVKRRTTAQVIVDVDLVGADGQLVARMVDYRATISASLVDAFCVTEGSNEAPDSESETALLTESATAAQTDLR